MKNFIPNTKEHEIQFKKIAIGSDHGGFEMKKILIGYLDSEYKHLEDFVVDCGCFSEERVDYPDIAHKVCLLIQKKEVEGGVLICGSGNGISIAANKHEGIICGIAISERSAIGNRMTRNANVLALGGKTTSFEDAKKFLFHFLNTRFQAGEDGRNSKRVKKLQKMYILSSEKNGK